jgi:hypothetical protein
MGQTITSATEIIFYAGDLRLAAKQAAAPELVEKIQRARQKWKKLRSQRLGWLARVLGRCSARSWGQDRTVRFAPKADIDAAGARSSS